MDTTFVEHHKWCNGIARVLANVSVCYPANVLRAMAAHFNLAKTLWCAFGLCAINCSLPSLPSISSFLLKY